MNDWPDRLKLFSTGLAAVVMTACAGSSNTETAGGEMAPVETAKTLVYDCQELRLVARTGPGELAVWLPEGYFVLGQVRSGSGVRYESDGISLWSKGNEAMLERPGHERLDCRLNRREAPWEDAWRRGVTFRGVGNEPGWSIEVKDSGPMLYQGNYGATRILLLDHTREILAEGVRFTAGNEDHDVVVTFTEALCADSMSGAQFPYVVTVNLDGIALSGCGRHQTALWE